MHVIWRIGTAAKGNRSYRPHRPVGLDSPARRSIRASGGQVTTAYSGPLTAPTKTNAFAEGKSSGRSQCAAFTMPHLTTAKPPANPTSRPPRLTNGHQPAPATCRRRISH